MHTWEETYSRLRSTREFIAYFSRRGRVPREGDFDTKVFVVPFEDVPGSSTAGVPGILQGPVQQVFEYGAVVMEVTAGAFVPQQDAGVADYGPSWNQGKRDTFVLHFQRTDDEDITALQAVLTPTSYNQLTPGGFASQFGLPARVIADSCLGSGMKTVFPEPFVISPGNGIAVSCASLLAASAEPTTTVHVALHCMVPRSPQAQVQS